MRMPEKAKKAIEAIFLRLLMHVIRQLRSIWLEEEVVEEEKGQEKVTEVFGLSHSIIISAIFCEIIK